MNDKHILLCNLDKLHTTEMGITRIKRNLTIETDDVVEYCRGRISKATCLIFRQGKNWYCEVDHMKITINAYSYTIITAHRINNEMIK